MQTIRIFLGVTAALIIAACGQSEADNQPVDDPVQDEQLPNAPDTADEKIIVDASADAPADVPEGTGVMMLGDENAPVALIEYASVTCPHCAAYHAYIFPILKEYYIEPGLVRFEFREFPTAPPQLSYLGSSIARCAAAQQGTDAYFAMVGTLFEHQGDWVSQDYNAQLGSFVTEAGLDQEAVIECVNGDAIFEAINENVRKGMEEDDVKGTPSFILAGEKLEGYNTATYEGYFEKIDAALTAAGATPPADVPPLPEITMAHNH